MVSVCRTGGVLAFGRGNLVRRPAVDPVPRVPLPDRARDRIPAREPSGRPAGRPRTGDRGRRYGDPRLQHPRTLGRPARLHSRRLRRRLGCRPCRPRGPSRPRWRSHMRHRPSRSGMQRHASPWPRSGRAVARRAARHRRARRQRDGAASRRCQAPAPRRDGRGSRCPQGCRAGRARRAGGDAPSGARWVWRRRAAIRCWRRRSARRAISRLPGSPRSLSAASRLYNSHRGGNQG